MYKLIMIKIAICDDEDIFLNRYMEILTKLRINKNYNIEILKFNCGEDLLSYINVNKTNFNIIFLDIIMDKINGIETAKKIRTIDEDIKIVFLTNSIEYALDSYEVKAFNYILKNSSNLESKITEVIDEIYLQTNNYIIINNQCTLEKINIKKIIYMESNKRKVIINTIENKYEIYEKLDNLYEKVKTNGFIKCHRSYIVNMNFIKKIESRDIITTRSNIIPISRNKIEEVKCSFMNYFENFH